MDTLSRKFEEGTCDGLSVVQPSWVNEIIDSYEGDQQIHNLIAKLSIDPNSILDVQYQQGVIRHQGHIWVGSSGQLRKKLISEFHTSS